MKKYMSKPWMVLLLVLLSTTVRAQVDVSPFLENSRVFNPTDIYLNYANSAILDHNFFSGPSSTNRIGIDIQPTSGYISILGNQFDVEGVAISDNSSYPVFIRNNVYGGFL
ncbi:MAG: hypothetical protein K9M54_09495 [Kiritimatiellales bacterium]|nr:hypothetical protein [Kiritimatiellales bacterium]MCF7864734.1 hypothetical protein [Kiritimatiellales bacterium]